MYVDHLFLISNPWHTLPFTGFWIDCFTQAVDQKVDTDGTQSKCNGREYPSPPELGDDFRGSAVIQHISPGRNRFADSKSQERSPDSVSIQVAKERVAFTMIIVITFGTIWRKIIFRSRTPSAFAAVTNSFWRSASTWHVPCKPHQASLKYRGSHNHNNSPDLRDLVPYESR